MEQVNLSFYADLPDVKTLCMFVFLFIFHCSSVCVNSLMSYDDYENISRNTIVDIFMNNDIIISGR